MRLFGALIAGVCAMAVVPAAAEQGFYQYPSARGDVLVFASEGDLWRTTRDGGTAVRLTNHPAEESEAHLSPDGTMIAFSASYDSERDVYVMPVAGGTPRRLTFEGGFVQTIGWTPDGRVIFASRLAGGGQGEVLYTVAPEGGAAAAIPLWRATGATFGSDGRTLFFSRRGLYARARDNAVLYRGGGMEQLWRWTMGSDAEAVRLLADFGAPIRNPMAAGGRIWFVSDKSGKDALWSAAEDGSDVRQVSPDLPFPVLQASIDGDAAFLQNGADIHAVSLATGAVRKLAINAFLGASYTPVAGGLRIDRILRSEDDLVSLHPPLRRPGVDVREGDVLFILVGEIGPRIRYFDPKTRPNLYKTAENLGQGNLAARKS